MERRWLGAGGTHSREVLHWQGPCLFLSRCCILTFGELSKDLSLCLETDLPLGTRKGGCLQTVVLRWVAGEGGEQRVPQGAMLQDSFALGENWGAQDQLESPRWERERHLPESHGDTECVSLRES